MRESGWRIEHSILYIVFHDSSLLLLSRFFTTQLQHGFVDSFSVYRVAGDLLLQLNEASDCASNERYSINLRRHGHHEVWDGMGSTHGAMGGRYEWVMIFDRALFCVL